MVSFFVDTMLLEAAIIIKCCPSLVIIFSVMRPRRQIGSVPENCDPNDDLCRRRNAMFSITVILSIQKAISCNVYFSAKLVICDLFKKLSSIWKFSSLL